MRRDTALGTAGEDGVLRKTSAVTQAAVRSVFRCALATGDARGAASEAAPRDEPLLY